MQLLRHAFWLRRCYKVFIFFVYFIHIIFYFISNNTDSPDNILVAFKSEFVAELHSLIDIIPVHNVYCAHVDILKNIAKEYENILNYTNP